MRAGYVDRHGDGLFWTDRPHAGLPVIAVEDVAAVLRSNDLDAMADLMMRATSVSWEAPM